MANIEIIVSEEESQKEVEASFELYGERRWGYNWYLPNVYDEGSSFIVDYTVYNEHSNFPIDGAGIMTAPSMEKAISLLQEFFGAADEAKIWVSEIFNEDFRKEVTLEDKFVFI